MQKTDHAMFNPVPLRNGFCQSLMSLLDQDRNVTGLRLQGHKENKNEWNLDQHVS